jgi:hypothetical protein
MLRIFPFLFLLLIGNQCIAQQGLDTILKKQLDSILVSDQGIREYLDTKVTESRKDSLSLLLGYSRTDLDKNKYGIMKKIDSVNLVQVEAIIKQHGYPGKSKVGEPTNEAVFYVIQHVPNKIPLYYKLIKRAGKSGELPYKYVAMMLDRKLTGQGKRQIYGTQGFMVMLTDPQTGQRKLFSYIMPIKNPGGVNKRRRKAGFDTTVEENAKRFDIEYKPYTRKEIKKIREAGTPKTT